jgi:hypothetical protein
MIEALLCSTSDVQNMFNISPGVPPFSQSVFDAHIASASSQFIASAKSVYLIPDGWNPSVTDVGSFVRLIVATIAGYHLIIYRGFQGEGMDASYSDRYKWALDQVENMQTNIMQLPFPLTDAAIPDMITSYRNTLIGPAGIVSGLYNVPRSS